MQLFHFSLFSTLQLVKSDAVKCMSPPSPITISRIIQPIVWSAVITIVLYSALSIPLSVLHPVRNATCVEKELYCILLPEYRKAQSVLHSSVF